MGYVCLECQAETEMESINEEISCPKCSGKILLKQANSTAKKVLSR